MDVFTGFDKRLPSIKPKTQGKRLDKGANAQKNKAPKKQERMDISPERIRELVAKNTAKSKPKSFESSEASKIPGFLKVENAPENGNSIIEGGFGENTAKSKLTQSKLKEVLNTNAFSFSDKERLVLNKILNKDS